MDIADEAPETNGRRRANLLPSPVNKNLGTCDDFLDKNENMNPPSDLRLPFDHLPMSESRAFRLDDDLRAQGDDFAAKGGAIVALSLVGQADIDALTQIAAWSFRLGVKLRAGWSCQRCQTMQCNEICAQAGAPSSLTIARKISSLPAPAIMLHPSTQRVIRLQDFWTTARETKVILVPWLRAHRQRR